MVHYEARGVFPRPIAATWDFLQLHIDDEHIRKIHPLILNQKTVRKDGTSVIVERSIDVRGKPLVSTWKITYEPPHRAKWEIVQSAGPWTQGSWLENTYADAPGGTMIDSRGELEIVGLPFFLSQRKWTAKVMDKVDSDDLAYLSSA